MWGYSFVRFHIVYEIDGGSDGRGWCIGRCAQRRGCQAAEFRRLDIIWKGLGESRMSGRDHRPQSAGSWKALDQLSLRHWMRQALPHTDGRQAVG
jgi:hypothetical protein